MNIFMLLDGHCSSNCPSPASSCILVITVQSKCHFWVIQSLVSNVCTMFHPP
jgi:hypothetical protein